MKLRSWQLEALNQVDNKFSQGQKLFLTHATPGGGKTIHGLSVFENCMQTHLIILAPSTNLVTQWQQEAKQHYNIELKAGMLYSQQADFDEYQGIVMTYQGMNENHENLRLFCSHHSVLVIADEIHHVSDGNSWGESFRNAFEPCDHILGLSGTPWTTEGKKISFVNYDKNGKAIPDYSYWKKDAIADNVCRTVEFSSTPATGLSFLEDESGVTIARYSDLQEAIDEDDVKGVYRKVQSSVKHMKKLFIRADIELKNLRSTGVIDAGGLLVAPDIRTAHLFQDEIMMLTGHEYPIVHSKMNKAQETIKEFKLGSDRWLISVDMVTEGVDIKRLQVCVFLSVKTTELFVRQVVGRIERRRNNSNSDLYGYFYYTSTKTVDEIVNRMIKENEAGVALKEDREPNDLDGDGGREFIPDGISLDDINTEVGNLIVNGFNFEKSVVIEAIKRRNNDQRLMVLPISHLCLVIMNERDLKSDITATEYQQSEAPLEEKKARIRKLINKTINKKLFSFFSGKPEGGQIRIAHRNINKKIGLSVTDENTSLEKLENKLEFITNTEVRSWL